MLFHISNLQRSNLFTTVVHRAPELGLESIACCMLTWPQEKKLKAKNQNSGELQKATYFWSYSRILPFSSVGGIHNNYRTVEVGPTQILSLYTHGSSFNVSRFQSTSRVKKSITCTYQLPILLEFKRETQTYQKETKCLYIAHMEQRLINAHIREIIKETNTSSVVLKGTCVLNIILTNICMKIKFIQD